MGARDRLFAPAPRRRCVTSQFPVSGEFETRVLDFTDNTRALDGKTSGAERLLDHALKRNAIQPLLIEPIHVLAIALTIGDYIESESGLITGRPAYEVIYFL